MAPRPGSAHSRGAGRKSQRQRGQPKEISVHAHKITGETKAVKGKIEEPAYPHRRRKEIESGSNHVLFDILMNSKTLNPEQHIFHSPKFQRVVNDAINFFARTPACKLPPPRQFVGPGVYGIYYAGDNERYKAIAEKNKVRFELPIYVGKAVPPGWRTARAKESTTPDLYRRLSEHARTIKQVSGLKSKDFCCRFMILSGIEGDLVVPVEAELIRRYKPLWNTVVDGFGNHDPGSGRYNQAKSEWDVLHPGRNWTKRLIGKAPRLQDILKKIAGYEKRLRFP